MNRPIHYILALLLTLALAPSAFADDSPRAAVNLGAFFDDRPAVEPVVLDNGLTVLVDENPAHPVAAVRVTVKAGSIYEGDYLGYGFSHVLEHIVHGGTTSKRTEDVYEKMLVGMGDSTNASTTYHRTNYYIACPSRDVATAITMLSEWMFDCAMDEKEWQRELGVVQRELERGLVNPGRVFWTHANKQQYRVHPARHPVIGYGEFLEGVDDPKRPQYESFRRFVRDYYERLYTPDNMVLAIAGDVKRDEVLKIVRETFGAAPRGRGTPAVLPEEPPQLGERREVFAFDVQETWYRLAFRSVKLSHPDLYPLDVMAGVLSSGVSSRLKKTIRDEKQLARMVTAWSYTPTYADGSFTVYARTQPAKLADLERAVWAELEKLKTEPVSGEELERVKIHMARRFIFEGQTPAERAGRLASDMLSTGNADFSRTYVENIRKVSAADVQRVARQYLVRDRANTLVMQPRGVDETATDKAEAIERGETKKIVLPNGLRVMFRCDTSHPSISVQAYVLGGVRYETEENNGITNLMAGLLTRGAGDRDAAGIEAAMDSIGGSISADAGRHTFYLKQQLLKGTLDPGLDVLADCLLRPTFDETEFARLKARTMAAIKAQNDDPSTQAFNFFREKMFKGSPHRLNPLGALESVGALTVEDVRRTRAKYVHPSNMVVSVVGNVTEDEVRRAMTKHLNFEPTAKAPDPPKAASAVQLDSSRSYHLDTPPRPSSFVIMGYPGMSIFDDKDRYAMAVLDGILSGYGPPGGFLHADLRGRSLVYVVHAFNQVGLDPGAFVIYAQCEPAKTDKVVELIEHHVNRMRTGDFTDDEFALARKACVAYETMQEQTNEALAAAVALDELYGRPIGHHREMSEGIARVTREDVTRVAKKYLTHKVLTTIGPDGKTQARKDTP